MTAFACRTLFLIAYLVPALWHGRGSLVPALAGVLLLIWAAPLARDHRPARGAVTVAAAAPSSRPGPPARRR